MFNRLIFATPATLTMKGGHTGMGEKGRLQRAKNLVKDWPRGSFELENRNGHIRIKPSRVWRTFEQKPHKIS